MKQQNEDLVEKQEDPENPWIKPGTKLIPASVAFAERAARFQQKRKESAGGVASKSDR